MFMLCYYNIYIYIYILIFATYIIIYDQNGVSLSEFSHKTGSAVELWRKKYERQTPDKEKSNPWMAGFMPR